MFVFEEKFLCWDESYKPYGIQIESSSKLWHKHAKASDAGYIVYCTGNKYLLEMPETKNFDIGAEYQFDALNDYAGISLFFGYNPERHCGYELRAEWYRAGKTLKYTIFSISDELLDERESVVVENIEFPSAGVLYAINISMNEGQLNVSSSSGGKAKFQVQADCGRLGFSRPHFVGNVCFRNIRATTKSINVQKLRDTSVTIPLVNGGTMPLQVNFSLFAAEDRSYLTATLDGGPQYRTEENYRPYPCNRKGQYTVERWFMKRPYVRVGGKKYYFSMDELNLADPFLKWKELLYQLLHFVDLPVSITVPIGRERVEGFAFGYDDLSVVGYRLQGGKNEFNFTVDGEYIGETVFPDTFRLCSPADKRAVKLIPETVFEYPIVKEHFEKNHYFAEDEDIVFTIFAHTDKDYITYEAELQNVFGEFMEKLSVSGGEIRHTPLPVGVYRIHLTVNYGGEVFKELDMAFEVFDETGKRCAPLESGLPVMFSMPNEQQYLDRDPFDPWNSGAPANVEHFYSVTAFTGHVAEYKRTWEVTKLFGRKWYVWLSDHRTMVDYDYHDHMDILKNADYIYYPSDYEWGVLRSDTFLEGLWESMPKTVELLNEFLDANEGARERVGYERGEKVGRHHITKLHQYYQREWYALLRQRILKGFEEQNEKFKKYNPDFKRACYGPFNAYNSTMRTSKLSEFYGFSSGKELSDVIYTGFAQFEDYPYSCAYHTYRGAFGAGVTLVHSPGLVIYPEQYKSAKGGCVDGAVYFANPPVGGYTMPDWYNTTLSREYVYNTARKTKDAFAYWNTYGFMKPDLTDSDIDPFIRDWKYVLKYQPQRPLRSAVYVCEFDSSDDGLEQDYPAWRAPYNISEEGIAYIYESSRLAGLPAGFFASWETLLEVTAEDTDMLVLPSTVSASPEVLEHIRTLYNAGVSVIAVSRVDGLEDLFGVKEAPREIKFYGIDSGDEHEAVYPYKDTIRYEADGADVVMSADGAPAIFRHNRTALYNISPAITGRSYFYIKAENARSSVSPLLRKTSIELVRTLSTPTAVTADGKCGITMFEDTNGNTMLLVIDYSEHDQSKLDITEEKTVMLKDGTWHNAEAVDGKPLRKLVRNDGKLDGIVVELHHHESALIRLV